ncbi:hypothetical protein U9M48_013365 [Paspalum notatum var. saurae]|uniref:Uncharacterized protein n=1 Tax=Paspalum notatum var. saurae TaxID=547442 RepID=A0AAQ3SZ45_PASNO
MKGRKEPSCCAMWTPLLSACSSSSQVGISSLRGKLSSLKGLLIMPHHVVESDSSDSSDEIQEEHLRRNPPCKSISKGKELAKPSSQSQREKVASK